MFKKWEIAMTTYNCIVCAEECNEDEMQSVALSKINSTKFKICQNCLDKCDPADDYRTAREIINSYLNFSEAKSLLKEAQEIVDSYKKL